MCLQVMLLSDRSLLVPPNAATFPGLKLDPIEVEYQSEALAGIRRISPATFAYDVSAGGYCGCHFQYQSEEEHRQHMADRAADPDVQYADTPEHAEAMWRSRVDGVNSLGRYLAAHPDAQLAVYAVWENCHGRKEPIRAEVPPSYFGGPGFEQLPEDLLLTIVPEPTACGGRPWDPAAPRTHIWLTGESCD